MVTSREGQHDSIYGPLIDRFFKKRPVEKGTQWLGASNYKYELSLDKRRVREALGLPSAKK